MLSGDQEGCQVPKELRLQTTVAAKQQPLASSPTSNYVFADTDLKVTSSTRTKLGLLPANMYVVAKASSKARRMRKPPKMRPCMLRCCGWHTNVLLRLVDSAQQTATRAMPTTYISLCNKGCGAVKGSKPRGLGACSAATARLIPPMHYTLQTHYTIAGVRCPQPPQWEGLPGGTYGPNTNLAP
jgi:hypothetical protein